VHLGIRFSSITVAIGANFPPSQLLSNLANIIKSINNFFLFICRFFNIYQAFVFFTEGYTYKKVEIVLPLNARNNNPSN